MDHPSVFKRGTVAFAASVAMGLSASFLQGQSVQIDAMEYATDALAQAAYASSMGGYATGGTITEVGGYRIHTFTTSGTFTPLTAMNVEALVVAGGGGGGSYYWGGGGGAGGVWYEAAHAVTAQAYSVTVGDGGLGGVSSNAGANGSNSVFSTMTAIGGGGGGSQYGGNNGNGKNGGSGGGSGAVISGTNVAGTGVPGQGHDGGLASSSAPAGGGGGAGTAGSPGTPSAAGNGGAGLAFSISGSTVYYAGGGGGGVDPAPGFLTSGTGGIGGGGNGSGSNGQDAVAHTGGGGGGGERGGTRGGNGGSGIVIIRYPMSLQDYSESTIKTQGSYALKGVAASTVSLNQSLTRTVSPTLNLANKSPIRFDVRASRSGINLKIGIHDSGGTTTEHTVNILSADTWQTEEWDITGVAQANRDAIDRITLTVVNADAANTFYVDNMYAEQENSPPAAFSLLFPSNLGSTSDKPTFNWSASTDPEGQTVRYALEISKTSDFIQPIYRLVSDITGTTYKLGDGLELADGTYYWKIIASDGETSTLSNQRSFTVSTSVPSIPTITGVIANSATGKISRLVVVADNSLGRTVSVKRKDPATGNFVDVSGNAAWMLAANTFTFDPDDEIDPDSMLYVSAGQGQITDPVSRTNIIQFGSLLDVFQDDTIFYGASGTSMRLEGATAYEFRAAVNGGSTVTVTARLRKNTAYGSGTQPRITLTGPGIDGMGAGTTAMTNTADTWQLLSVSGLPSTAGVLQLKLETYSNASGAAVWIDDIAVSQ